MTNNSHYLRDHFILITKCPVPVIIPMRVRALASILYQDRKISEKAEWSLRCSSPVASSEASSAPTRADQWGAWTPLPLLFRKELESFHFKAGPVESQG